MRCLLACCLDASTWSPRLSELVEAFQVSLLPYNLELNYDYWNYRMYVSPPKPTNPFVDLERKRGVAHSYYLGEQMT